MAVNDSSSSANQPTGNGNSTMFLIPGLVDDVVVSHIFPKLLWFVSADEICKMRAISTSWRDLIGSGVHWKVLRPLLANGQPRLEWLHLGWTLDDMMYNAIDVLEANGE